jgi:hypothetical protein
VPVDDDEPATRTDGVERLPHEAVAVVDAVERVRHDQDVDALREVVCQ